MRVVYLVLAGGSSSHGAHKKSQIQSWANNLNPNHRIIWLHGNPSVEAPIETGNDLFLPVTESYENLLGKTVLATNWVLENLEFDYLVRTNTSNYFHFPLVEQHLKRLTTQSLNAGGVVAKWRGTICGEKRDHTYISGAGIFLSSEAVKCLGSMKVSDYKDIPDDVAIGHWLGKFKVNFLSIPRNDITDYKRIKPSPQTRVKSWNYSQFTTERMVQIHKIYLSSTRDELALNLRKFLAYEVLRAKIEHRKRSKIFMISSWLNYPYLLRLFSRALMHGRL